MAREALPGSKNNKQKQHAPRNSGNSIGRRRPDGGETTCWNPFGSGFDLAAIGALAKSARVMPPPASPTSAGATHDYAVENIVLGDEGHHRQRRSKRADALVAGAYFAGTSMRRVCWALAALFGGAAGKDTGSRFGARQRAFGTLGMAVRSPMSRSSG